jgi:hypothetical protein
MAYGYPLGNFGASIVGQTSKGIHAFVEVAIAVIRISAKALSSMLCRKMMFARPYRTEETATEE